MTFGAEEVTNAALQALAMAKKNRDKSYEESNMIYMLNKSLDECEEHATREKLFQLKNDYSDEKINNAFAMDRLKLLLSNKEASYMFDDMEAKVNKYIDNCLTREIDPVVHATQHLDRSGVVQYSDLQIWNTFQKMHTCISATDFEKKEVFKEIPNYINQLRTNVYTISLFGEVNSGKSTVVNCIIGLEVAHTFVETCTALPVIYENDQHQEISILTLCNYFLQHGFNRTYEGAEILPILTSINEVSRKRQDDLNYDDWPLIKVRFRNAIRPIRIIDSPGISEQNEVLTNYSKQALGQSFSTMVYFRCDRINTDIEQSLKENLSGGKHLCLVANRWHEYQHNVEGDKTVAKEALRSRLEQTYQKVFVTIADIGFLRAKMAKITTTSKPTWEAAKPWAQKCINTTLTNLKELESDYEEMSLCTFKRRIDAGLHNFGIDELVNYINGDMVNEIKYKAISYVCTAFITHLQQFENKNEKEGRMI